MGKRVYVGVNSVARRVKKLYVGVNGVARKVKRAYVGVNGIARLCFTGEPQKVTGLTTLSTHRRRLVGANIGNYILFAGGYWALDAPSATVDGYNSSLTRVNVSYLDGAADNLAGGDNGNYALFAGGRNGSDSILTNVTAYNSSLTRSLPTSLSVARERLAATRVGNSNYILFAGGRRASYDPLDTVEAYNGSLTRSTITSLSVARMLLAGGIGGIRWGIFAGGYYGNKITSAVDAYDTQLTRASQRSLSEPRYSLAGGSVDYSYGLFAGGFKNTLTGSAVVDAYDSSLIRYTSPPVPLSGTRAELAAASGKDHVLFGGGYKDRNIVDAYDDSLSRTILPNLDVGRSELAGGYVNGYYMFAGGTNSSSTYWSAVDAYKEP